VKLQYSFKTHICTYIMCCKFTSEHCYSKNSMDRILYVQDVVSENYELFYNRHVCHCMLIYCFVYILKACCLHADVATWHRKLSIPPTGFINELTCTQAQPLARPSVPCVFCAGRERLAVNDVTYRKRNDCP
jgi:hypothetical protein